MKVLTFNYNNVSQDHCHSLLLHFNTINIISSLEIPHYLHLLQPYSKHLGMRLPHQTRKHINLWTAALPCGIDVN